MIRSLDPADLGPIPISARSRSRPDADLGPIPISAQVINVLIGLGLPWAILNASGGPIEIDDHESLTIMGCYQLGCIAAYAGLVLLPTVPTWGGRGRASLGHVKGLGLIASYVVASYAAGLYILRDDP